MVYLNLTNQKSLNINMYGCNTHLVAVMLRGAAAVTVSG